MLRIKRNQALHMFAGHLSVFVFMVNTDKINTKGQINRLFWSNRPVCPARHGYPGLASAGESETGLSGQQGMGTRVSSELGKVKRT